MDEVTTIKVRKKTRDRLARFGNKLQTFDGIINQLMDFYERSQRSPAGNHAARVQSRHVR